MTQRRTRSAYYSVVEELSRAAKKCKDRTRFSGSNTQKSSRRGDDGSFPPFFMFLARGCATVEVLISNKDWGGGVGEEVRGSARSRGGPGGNASVGCEFELNEVISMGRNAQTALMAGCDRVTDWLSRS